MHQLELALRLAQAHVRVPQGLVEHGRLGLRVFVRLEALCRLRPAARSRPGRCPARWSVAATRPSREESVHAGGVGRLGVVRRQRALARVWRRASYAFTASGQPGRESTDGEASTRGAVLRLQHRRVRVPKIDPAALPEQIVSAEGFASSWSRPRTTVRCGWERASFSSAAL